MGDVPALPEPIRPFKYYLQGLCIPVLVILATAAISVVLFTVIGRGLDVFEALVLGAFMGFFISIIGALEMLIGLLIVSDIRFLNRLWRVGGYCTVWLAFTVLSGFIKPFGLDLSLAPLFS
ncbi:MAG: hypothetical protein AAFW65_03130 [Pseudomonadota bacterium]